MLDPWIIEEILKKEEERRREDAREQPQLPVDRWPTRPRGDTGERPAVTPPEPERGVMIIDI